MIEEVSCIIKKGINAIKFNKIHVKSYDSLFVQLKKNNKKYILGVLHTAPRQSEEIDMMLYNENETIHKDINEVKCGDFNNLSINWKTLTGHWESRRLIDIV